MVLTGILAAQAVEKFQKAGTAAVATQTR